jgi:cell division protein FtsB
MSETPGRYNLPPRDITDDSYAPVDAQLPDIATLIQAYDLLSQRVTVLESQNKQMRIALEKVWEKVKGL